jgi:hypothetical protein
MALVNNKKLKKTKTTNSAGGSVENNALYCSPSRHNMGVQDKTCMTVNELREVAKDYNEFVEKMGIEKTKKVKLSSDKQDLVKQMNDYLTPHCRGDKKGDHCWVQQDFVAPDLRNKILDKAFRPLKPNSWYKNRQTWLNTYDILNVMNQYQDKYKDFLFLGVFPIDFQEVNEYGQCIATDMCGFKLSKMLSKGKKRFGMVLNLDRHDQSGSHWVALYCNLSSRRKNFGIYYYDSVSNTPPKEVAEFMKGVEKQTYEVFSKKVADRFAMRYNKIQKQFDNYDCGVFSEVFLTQILKDIPFDIICKKMKTDREINALRDVLYTPSKM